MHLNWRILFFRTIIILSTTLTYCAQAVESDLANILGPIVEEAFVRENVMQPPLSPYNQQPYQMQWYQQQQRQQQLQQRSQTMYPPQQQTQQLRYSPQLQRPNYGRQHVPFVINPPNLIYDRQPPKYIPPIRHTTIPTATEGVQQQNIAPLNNIPSGNPVGVGVQHGPQLENAANIETLPHGHMDSSPHAPISIPEHMAANNVNARPSPEQLQGGPAGPDPKVGARSELGLGGVVNQPTGPVTENGPQQFTTGPGGGPIAGNNNIPPEMWAGGKPPDVNYYQDQVSSALNSLYNLYTNRKCDQCDGNCRNILCYGCGGCSAPADQQSYYYPYQRQDAEYHDAFTNNAMALSGLVLYPFPKRLKHFLRTLNRRKQRIPASSAQYYMKNQKPRLEKLERRSSIPNKPKRSRNGRPGRHRRSVEVYDWSEWEYPLDIVYEIT